MKRSVTKRSLVSLGLVVSLWVPRGAAVVHAVEPTLTLSYPPKIGDLSFTERRDPSEESHSTQLVYKAPGMTLTLYVFGGGPELPDGVDSPQFSEQFNSAVAAIHDPRAWKRAKQLREGNVSLGVAPNLIPGREAVFKVSSDESKAMSYLYLAAAGHVFFKARFTAGVEREVAERNAVAIREAVGETIRQAVHQE